MGNTPIGKQGGFLKQLHLLILLVIVNLNLFLIMELAAVSYTHLDVYKRQAKAIAAVIQRFQYLGNLSGGFLLFKGCNHTLPLTVCIAAQTQHMVNICLLYTSRCV